MKYFLLPLLLFSGCASSFIAGQSYEPKGVTIGYNNGMMVAEQNRQHAFQSAHDYCGGGAKLISEGSDQRFTGRYTGTTYRTPVMQNQALLNFVCD